jgi:acetyltransferase
VSGPVPGSTHAVSRARLDVLLCPRTVAVIGASRDPSKVGGSVLANLRAAGFAGRIFPVNPRDAVVQGVAAIPSLRAAPEPVDLAVITVPAAHVQDALRECAASGVRAAVVISAGFREIGGEGAQRETALREWIGAHPIRVLGPNCLGWIRPSRRLNCTFAAGMPEPGAIAFVSHSGALGAAILDWARDRGLGLSLFASLGNQADITEADVLELARDDPETRVVALYVEGVANGPRFLEALRSTAARKPVVVLKAGRSAEGARAVSSHTGALAGSDRAFDAAVKQAGAVRVDTVEALFDLARALASQPLPRGRRLTIVTNGGGLGIVAADAAHEAELDVAPLDRATRDRLSCVLPPTASLLNPVDLIGDADAARYGSALSALGGGDVGAVLVLLTAQASTDAAAVARAVASATRDWRTPVAAAFVGGARVARGARTLEEAGIPCYAFPEPAVRTLAGMARVAERRAPRVPAADGNRERADHGAPLTRLRAASGAVLGMRELEPVLTGYGIPCVAARAAVTPADAARVAQELGWPVALKVLSGDISHKSDIGGVRLGLGSQRDVEEATAAMLAVVRRARPDARVDGVLVQRMAPPGKELLVGMVRDPQFGPMIVVGLGGIYVEVLNDTAARLCPVTAEDALEMLSELKMAPVLRGMRGQPAVNLEALADAIRRFAELATDATDLAEMELNPLMAGPDGVVAVDARARRSEEA